MPKDGADIPEFYRMPEQALPARLTLLNDLKHSGVEIHRLTFPSPVKSSEESNNTVYGKLFRPKSPGKKPAVIVLDILDGKQLVAESQAHWLAANDVTALVITMAYYGPRRPVGSSERMLTPNIEKSVANVRQTVLDCRCAAAWLASRPDVDAAKIGILGTSLGSFVGGVVAGVEPRLSFACLLLGGGGLVDAFWTHPKAEGLLKALEFVGIEKKNFKKLIDPIDPITYAERLKPKKLLLIAASQDDVVPPLAMKQLAEATGNSKNVIWYDATHVGAAAYMIPMTRAVVRHVTE
jgi:dienelactone hydrolase